MDELPVGGCEFFFQPACGVCSAWNVFGVPTLPTQILVGRKMFSLLFSS